MKEAAELGPAILRAALELRDAAADKKCWRCSCLHDSLRAIERDLAPAKSHPELESAIHACRERLEKTQYDCLGCETCFPARAVNALCRAGVPVEVGICPTDAVQERSGWPPLPGAYDVLRFQAPVAVCTLVDDALRGEIARRGSDGIAIVGTLKTENLGIERLIQNVLADPNIRFLVVCGPDSREAIGHLPGQSLVALHRSGLDEDARIVGAQGKRPILRNVARAAVEHFRNTVEVVNRIGETDADLILESVRECTSRDPGPALPFENARVVAPIAGHPPERMIPDPAGYFVLYVDADRGVLCLEHYGNDGVLDVVIEGPTAGELYGAAIDRRLVSRLDHAAYLGRELARAERALATGEPYVQDGAPEQEARPTNDCGCVNSSSAF